MLRNRLYMALLALATAGLLLYSGEPLLLAVLVVQLVLVLLMGLLVRHDAALLHTSVKVRSGGQDGKELPILLTVRASGPLFVTRSVIVEMEGYNTMFGTTGQKRYLLPITGAESSYEVKVHPSRCGRITVSCRGVWVQDLLQLFTVRTEAFAPVQSVIHPHRVQVEVELSRTTIGAPRVDGLMQNRKGTDQREMFDIREYTPGDDIRSIHWKLSAKADELIVRQASDPTHYDIVMLPDFGRLAGGKPTDAAECNAAAAYGAAIGAQLVRQGAGFCMALPGPNGLELHEAHTPREYQQMIAHWLSCPVRENSGDALRYFLMEKLDSQFTRLLILSAGEYSPELTRLDGRIGVTVLCAERGAAVHHAALGPTSETVKVPAEVDSAERCRLLC